jgi:putative transposase
MIQVQLKLKLNQRQEAMLTEWLFVLTGVWNWAIRKIELDAKDGIYHSPKDFQNLLADHCKKLGIPSHVIQGILSNAHLAWKRYFKKLAKRPRLKGIRNKLNSIPLPDPFRAPKGGRITIPSLKSVRFHKQAIPEGTIKCGRIVKRASGWYLCLFIDAQSKAIPHKDNLRVGIDPGFKHVITLSTGEKKEHPRELEQAEARLAQAQRGNRKRLAARLHERISNQRKDRNHKLSRELVENCSEIYFSDDNHKAIARSFGKSVSSSGHAQLRRMLSYKCRTGGRKYAEVASRHSTRAFVRLISKRT